jgi:hypothetical protein
MTASVDRLGRRCSFMKGLFAKTRSLHKDIIPERKNGPGRLAIIVSSVADPGCLSRIPDPDFYPSRIRTDFNADPNPTFYVTADPDPGFLLQKNKIKINKKLAYLAIGIYF